MQLVEVEMLRMILPESNSKKTTDFWAGLAKKLMSENSVNRKTCDPDQEANNPCINDNKVEK